MRVHARIRRLVATAALASVALALLVRCSSSDRERAPDSGGAESPSFRPGAAPIDPLAPSDASLPTRAAILFGSTCQGGPETACHGSGAAGLHLLLLRDGGDVVNVPSTERPELVRVKPREPESSYLFLKVAGDGGIDGSMMPPFLDPDPRIPDLIGRWITSGAELP